MRVLSRGRLRITPLHRPLVIWGLTPDDLGVLSVHKTSTRANEHNETHPEWRLHINFPHVCPSIYCLITIYELIQE